MNQIIERNFIAANLSKVEKLIDAMTPDDVLTRMSLESRRDELRQSLAAMDAAIRNVEKRPLASVSLYFGGKPVANGRGIESEFGADVVSKFQDIVSEVFAIKKGEALASKGPVPGKERSRLHITNVVRGSFGFQLEEIGNQPLFDSDLKESVEQAAKIMASFDNPADDALGEAIEEVGSRILEDIRKFFETIQAREATFRIESAVIYKEYNRESLARAVERARTTAISEHSEILRGMLLGILPEKREFEYRTESDTLIRGKIDMPLASEDLPSLALVWLKKDSRATFRVRDLSRQGTVYRQAYFLEGINPPTDGDA